MPRLFTGLRIPTEIAQDLALLRGGLAGARWIEPEDYHVTLRFIGDVGLPLAREIHCELARIQREPLAIALNEIDSFGGTKPRALVIRVRATPDLIALQAQHDRAILRAGGSRDTRKFSPHVTLARLRNTSPSQIAHFLGARTGPRTWNFTANEFELFSARDSVGGGPYLTEAIYPLRASDPQARPANSQ